IYDLTRARIKTIYFLLSQRRHTRGRNSRMLLAGIQAIRTESLINTFGGAGLAVACSFGSVQPDKREKSYSKIKTTLVIPDKVSDFLPD
ncbi:MAG: hypothetical protein ACTHMB_24140, partial [Candidatus Binatia bacterium]